MKISMSMRLPRMEKKEGISFWTCKYLKFIKNQGTLKNWVFNTFCATVTMHIALGIMFLHNTQPTTFFSFEFQVDRSQSEV